MSNSGGTEQNKKYGSARIIIILAVLIATTIAVLNYNFIFDIIDTLNYSAPEEISALENELSLTDDSTRIFRASHPVLEDNVSFNEHCSSHNSEISVLGCYTGRQIYLYNIPSDELNGIIESTAAHELLHAVWTRLNILEQASLKDEIQKFYNAHPELNEELENYPEEDRLDELHSRIGTEYAELPEALENHYKKYFKNQDEIVAFYDKYSAKFLELRDEIEKLDTEIAAKKVTVDKMHETYDSRLTTLNSKIDEFNACAAKTNCFTESEFNSRRATLLAEQDALEDYYYELNATIEAYNVLVDEYNANVLRSRNLENAVNSNASEVESL